VTTPSLTGIVFSDLTRAIDDRWLVAGSEARSLLEIELLRVGQAGGVDFRRSYTLPLDVCATPAARILTNDGPSGTGTGFIVAGECLSQRRGFVVHLDASGAVLGVRSRREAMMGRSLARAPASAPVPSHRRVADPC